jgi:hypothetical protein
VKRYPADTLAGPVPDARHERAAISPTTVEEWPWLTFFSDFSHNRLRLLQRRAAPCLARFPFPNQWLAQPAKSQGSKGCLQIISLKNVTDEQAMHRLPRFSGIIAPPYDRVRKPS